MSRFGEYFRRWAPRWVSAVANGEGERQLSALADMFEALRDSGMKARRQWFPSTCEPVVLWVHGRDRDLARYPNETEAAYRARLARAKQIHDSAGTKPGLELALNDAGFEGAIAFELFNLGMYAIADGTYQADGEIDASHNVHAHVFDVQIPIVANDAGHVLTASELELVRAVVDDMKSAESMLSAIVALVDLVDEDAAPYPNDESMTVTITTYNIADGTHLADGTIDADAVSTSSEVL